MNCVFTCAFCYFNASHLLLILSAPLPADSGSDDMFEEDKKKKGAKKAPQKKPPAKRPSRPAKKRPAKSAEAGKFVKAVTIVI